MHMWTKRWGMIFAGLTMVAIAAATPAPAEESHAVPAAKAVDQLTGWRADVDRMIALLESKEFEKLVNEHYAEKWKLARDKMPMDQFIQIFKTELAPRLLTLLKEARAMTPAFSDDGKSADLKWPDGKARMAFQRLETGKWGFNL